MINISFNEQTNAEWLRLTGEYLIKLADLNRKTQACEAEPTKAKKRPAAAAAKDASSDVPVEAPAFGPATTTTLETLTTLEAVRALLKAKADAGKRKQVQELLAGYGVTNLTQIPIADLAGLYAKGEQL